MTYKKVEKHIFRNELTKLYNVRVVVNPFTRKATGLTTLGAARAKVAEFKTELQEYRSKRSNGVVTFEEAIQKFLEHRSTFYKPSGVYSLKTSLATYTADLRSMMVTDIKREDIEQLGHKLLTRIQPATVDRVIRHIKAVFSYLEDLGNIERNPCKGVKFSKAKYDRKASAMNRSDIIKLLNFTRNTDHPLHAHFQLAYLTGARSGELKELRVKDYNRELKHIVISRSFCSKTKTIGPTKNGKSRVVPLPNQAIELIESLVLNKDRDDFILPFNKQFVRGEAAKELKKVQNQLQISNTNFHSIRGSFITHLLLKKVDIGTVQELVGHCDLKTTQAYIRLCGADLVGSTNCLGYDDHSESTEAEVHKSKVLKAISGL